MYVCTGYSTTFQYMYTKCTDQIRVTSISPSLTLLYQWRLRALFFYLFIKYILGYCELWSHPMRYNTRNIFLWPNSDSVPITKTPYISPYSSQPLVITILHSYWGVFFSFHVRGRTCSICLSVSGLFHLTWHPLIWTCFVFTALKYFCWSLNRPMHWIYIWTSFSDTLVFLFTLV